MPLSDEGRAQAERLGKRLASVTIAQAISSPLGRAAATAQAIVGPRIVLDDGLLEISHGAWEGLLASDVERDHSEMFGVWRTSPGRDRAGRVQAPNRSAMSKHARGRCSRGFGETLGSTRHRDDRRARCGQPRAALPRARPAARTACGRSRQSPAALNVLSPVTRSHRCRSCGSTTPSTARRYSVERLIARSELKARPSARSASE